jgi:hypothetical protein
MADEGQQPPAQQQAAPSAASIRFPPFWSNSPAAWFRTAEAHFTLRGVTDPVEKFLVVLTALSEDQADRVKAIVEAEPSATSYTAIRNALVSSHSLTPFQLVDQIVNMEPLGHRKPTELLAAMAKFRPAEDYHFFAYHFLQRLPREVRVLLSQEECRDMQSLAEKADGLMALHLPQHHDVAAVPAEQQEPADDTGDVAAVSGRSNKKGKKKPFKKHAGKQRKEFESLQSPLCYFHVRYGDKATRCEEPCAWPAEN